jgi:hypothetical protein
MRSIAPLGLRNSMQVSNHYFVVRPRANGLGVIAHGGLVDHIPMTGEGIPKWKPAVLEVVVYDLAF